MKLFHLLIVLVLAFGIFGCTSHVSQKVYVCPDGQEVSDKVTCGNTLAQNIQCPACDCPVCSANPVKQQTDNLGKRYVLENKGVSTECSTIGTISRGYITKISIKITNAGDTPTKKSVFDIILYEKGTVVDQSRDVFATDGLEPGGVEYEDIPTTILLFSSFKCNTNYTYDITIREKGTNIPLGTLTSSITIK